MLRGRCPWVLPTILMVALSLTACGDDEGETPFLSADASIDPVSFDGAAGGSTGGSAGGAGMDAGRDAPRDSVADSPSSDGDAGTPCTTRITYGSSWLHGDNHPNDFDLADGMVSWDGSCAFDGTNSYATLSNGWKPYFQGASSCVIALDYDSCAQAPSACETRVAYGASWLPGPNHPQSYDDAAGPVLWSGACHNDGSGTYASLSNGWTPYFSGQNACDLSFRYIQCRGLYANPVVASDCPDPGVVYDGSQYVMACTSGNASDAFPLRTSTDLVHWQPQGHVFPSSAKPSWAASDFWAPEIHRVGSGYVAYFTARHHDGMLCIGAATASSATGPFADIGQPLLHDANMGLIDATHFQDSQGVQYLLWKEDGNAVGQPTPIHGQTLSEDGLSLTGSRTTLITNDQGWEGALVEGPWMVEHDGQFYLFYSANGYASPSYAIGVARASSPLGSFTKAVHPVVATAGAWAGPGHGSVLETPNGETWHVYHSWRAGQVGGGDGRLVLVDRVFWQDGWPTMLAAPSSQSLPPP